MYMGYDDSYFKDYKSKCFVCGSECYDWDHKCPNCGHEMYDSKLITEYEEVLRDVLEFARLSEREKEVELVQEMHSDKMHIKQREPMLSDEEMLVTGIYPNTPFFKEYLILKILNKD